MIDMSTALGASPADGGGWNHRRLSATSRPTAAPRNTERVDTVARLNLARANVLRVYDGRGTLVRALSGVYWITEEGSVEDTVLRPGDVHVMRNQGMALVHAQRAGRVALEVAHGDHGPRMLEIALGDGHPTHRVVLLAGGSAQRRRVAGAFAAVARRLFNAMRELSRWASGLGGDQREQRQRPRFRVPYY